MSEARYRILSHDGALHDAVWELVETPDSLGIALDLDPAMDTGDLRGALNRILWLLSLTELEAELECDPGKATEKWIRHVHLMDLAGGTPLLRDGADHTRLDDAVRNGARIGLTIGKSHTIEDRTDFVAAVCLRDAQQLIVPAGQKLDLGKVPSPPEPVELELDGPLPPSEQVELPPVDEVIAATKLFEDLEWLDAFATPPSYKRAFATPPPCKRARVTPPPDSGAVGRRMIASVAPQDESSSASDGSRLVSRSDYLQPVPPIDAFAIHRSDPRFRRFVAPHRDLRELISAADPMHWAITHELLQELASFRKWLASLTLEEEAEYLLQEMLGPRQSHLAPALLGRFGSDGLRVHTLAEVGAELGVTRERARQILAKLQVPERPLYATVAGSVVELLDHVLPCGPSELAEIMATAGLTRLDEWHAEALSTLLSLSGHRYDLSEALGLVGTAEQLKRLGESIPLARAMSNRQGLVSVQEVVHQLMSDGGVATASDVTLSLNSSQMVHWIRDDLFWIDHPPGRNRLVNTLLRMLAVVSPLPLEDLWEGVERNFRWRSATNSRLGDLQAPAPDELEAFLRSHPAFEFCGPDAVTALEPVELDSLGAEKLAVVGILRAERDGLMHRNQLMQACRDAGVNVSTANVFLTYGECFKNYGHNVWGVRGLKVAEAAVLRTQREGRAAARAEDRTRLSGVTDGGLPWTAFRVTSSILFSGVTTSAWFTAHYSSETELDAIDLSDGEQVGTLKFSGSFNYGYYSLLAKYGPRVGEVVRVVGDVEKRVCFVELGGSELLQEPFDF